MVQGVQMKVMTHLAYEDLFNQIEKSGLTLPLSCLSDEKIINELIDELISGLDPVEAISYSSFLNMIVQTCDPKESAQLGRKDIAAVGFKKEIPDNKVFFHRDCLLHIMARLIEGSKEGTIHITGGSDRRGTAKYYKAMLLINSEINRFNNTAENKRHTLLKDYFIRDYPPPYSRKTTSIIYKNRLQRYWHIYNQILPQMEPHEREVIYKGINVLEKDSGLTLRDHYSVIAIILSWFLILPVKKREKNNNKIPSGFNYDKVDSFYIRKNNFPDTDRLIRLIKFLAQDMNCMQKHFASNRRDRVNGFYRNCQNFFDRPVFKIDDHNFCILDLKFLIESLCSGFLWRIEDKASLQNIHQEMKGYYGQLLEKYFVFLIEQIFANAKIGKSQGSGPDAIVETDDCLIIFEFTTEYFRFASLYNASIDFAKEDLHRLLFNQGNNDPLSRGKKDRGKFLKLNEYMNTTEKHRKTILPILVTENYLGDFDLLNQFDNILDTKIQEYGLTNVRVHKPLILCLDDLEIFWALCTEAKSVQEFEECLLGWEKSDKGKVLYNFSNYISSKNDAVIKNGKYLDFFDYSKFLKELAA